MWTQQTLSDGSLVPYATLGWATGVRGGHRYFTHGGLQPGTTTVMHWVPDLGAGSVVLCNAEGPELDGLQERILDILVGRKQRYIAYLRSFRVGMVLFVHAILAGIGLCKLWVIPSSNWKR